MEIESTAFTTADLKSFMSAYRNHERDLLADRLENVSRRLAKLGPRIKPSTPGGDGWSAHEVLAHIAVVSKFYGVLVHRIASGQLTDMDLLESVHMRDVAGSQMAQQETADLVRMALADQERTVKTLRGLDVDSLGRSARAVEGLTMTAEEVARLPLVGHLEIHLVQLEKALAGNA